MTNAASKLAGQKVVTTNILGTHLLTFVGLTWPSVLKVPPLLPLLRL